VWHFGKKFSMCGSLGILVSKCGLLVKFPHIEEWNAHIFYIIKMVRSDQQLISPNIKRFNLLK
jgi:hypothetical protein